MPAPATLPTALPIEQLRELSDKRERPRVAAGLADEQDDSALPDEIPGAEKALLDAFVAMIAVDETGSQDRYAISTSSISCVPEPTTSPTAFPIRDFATGETNEIDPAFGSASSSPTMR